MIGYEFARNLSVEADFSMNEMEEGNSMNGELVTETIKIASFNGSLSYSLGGLFNLPVIDPYIKAGIGHLRLNETDLTMASARSEEHTSELQSRPHLVCRLLLE